METRLNGIVKRETSSANRFYVEDKTKFLMFKNDYNSIFKSYADDKKRIDFEHLTVVSEEELREYHTKREEEVESTENVLFE